MPGDRRLRLRREALDDLSRADLQVLAAAGPSRQTCGSCLTYVSCNLTDCLLRDTVQVDCVGSETVTC